MNAASNVVVVPVQSGEYQKGLITENPVKNILVVYTLQNIHRQGNLTRKPSKKNAIPVYAWQVILNFFNLILVYPRTATIVYQIH